MIVTIHQPEHLIWLGLLDKINKADKYVILDTVQFRKNYFQNRNKIRTKKEWEWLTIPLEKHSSETIIKDILISTTQNWKLKYLNKIKDNYSCAPFFDNYFYLLKEVILNEYTFLCDLNLELLKLLMNWFDIDTQLLLASNLDLPFVKGGTEVNYQIAKSLGAKAYLSGPFGKKYLDITPFRNSNIDVIFHELDHPEYSQQYSPFIPYMSAIDLLFNCGPDSKKIMFKEA